MTLHGSNTSLASADQTLSGHDTEDLVTPQVKKAPSGLLACKHLWDSQQ